MAKEKSASAVTEPRYDLLAGSIQVFDWKNTGKLFKEELMGLKDVELRKQFEDLLANGYRIVGFSIVGNTAYFLFEK